jgi:citrate lyase subunit gamma (acyl carrier protein)
MNIVRLAVAGTLESNDVLVSVAPGEGRVEIEVESIVLDQFGENIRQAAQEVIGEIGITSAKVRLEDRGALDCTVKARVETALRRAGEAQK